MESGAQALRRSAFRRLPLEIVVHLVSVMDMPTLFEFSKVCHLFNRLCNDPNLWWMFCVRQFGLRRAARKRSIHRSVNWKLYFLERYTLEKPGSMFWETKSFSKSPPERYSHSANVVGSNVVFIGGEVRSAKRFKDVYLLDAKTLKVKKMKVTGKIQPISRHQACTYGNSIYVFGGFDGKSQFNNLSVLDMDTGVWSTPIVRGHIPKPRSNHACAIVGDKLYMYGGNNQHETGRYQVLDDFYMLDISNLIWTRMNEDVSGDIPEARSGHRFLVFGTNILLFGGGQWDDRTEQWLHKFNDIHIFDTEKLRWKKPKVRGQAEICTFPAICRMGYQMFVFGGQSMQSNWTTNTLYYLDTVAMEWHEVPFDQDAYKPRCRDMASLSLLDAHTACLFGGNHAGPQNDWNMLRMTWRISDFEHFHSSLPLPANSSAPNSNGHQ